MITKPDYTELDAAILEAVARPNVRTMLQVTGAVRGPLADVSRGKLKRNGKPVEEFRVLDGRLQALRRAGKIEHHHRNGWQRREQ